MTLTITPSEWALIEHRLSMSDCIGECLCDTFGWVESEIVAKADALYAECEQQMKMIRDSAMNALVSFARLMRFSQALTWKRGWTRILLSILEPTSHLLTMK